MRARKTWLRVSVWLLLATSVAPAIAQSTREQWLALRQNKETERTLAATTAGDSATRTNVLTVTSMRFFSDASGRLLAVGEARNASAVTLAYARLEFVFYDAAGRILDRSRRTCTADGTNSCWCTGCTRTCWTRARQGSSS